MTGRVRPSNRLDDFFLITRSAESLPGGFSNRPVMSRLILELSCTNVEHCGTLSWLFRKIRATDISQLLEFSSFRVESFSESFEALQFSGDRGRRAKYSCIGYDFHPCFSIRQLVLFNLLYRFYSDSNRLQL